MGQTNLKRTLYKPREEITSSLNSNVQTMLSVAHLRVGDRVDYIDVDPNGNMVGGAPIVSNLTILAINPVTKKIVLDSPIDSSAATETPMLRVDDIDDGQEAIERIYRDPSTSKAPFSLIQNILRVDVNTPIVGQATYHVADASFWRAGDEAKVVDDTGVLIANLSVVSVSIAADASNNKSKIVVDDPTAVSLVNNPYIQNDTIDLSKAVLRNQERIDEIDRPTVNQNFTPAIGNGADTCFEVPALFVQGTSKVYIDKGRQKLGTPGTRAQLIVGAGNGQLTAKSMILGLLGNEVELEVLNAAGLTVQVVKTFKRVGASDYTQSQYKVRVNNNSNAATAAQIAAAINADAAARRIMQVIYGGDGSGVVAALAPTNLTGGLDNGSGDYAELEQVYENLQSGTGFKFVSFWILSDVRNRLSEPPADDEEVWGDFTTAADNIDR